MKRGGLGGALLLAAAAIVALALSRAHSPARAPAQTAAPPAAEQPPVPPQPPLIPSPEEPLEPAKAGARLVGRVTDEEGHPIAGAELLLAERNRGGKVVARTGDDGKYLADGVEGKDLLVGAIANGHAPSNLHPIGDAERPVYEIDFTLRRGGGSLSLVIRTWDGKDPEARVNIEPFFTEEVEPLWDDEEALLPLPGGHRVLGAQGGATVDGLVPEWNRVRVYAHGYAPVFLPVRLHPGGPVEVTVPLTAGATLVGTVRSVDGAPVPDAKVRSVVWGWHSLTWTDAGGAYRIEHLPTGRVEMKAEGGGGEASAFLELEERKESRWDPALRPPAVIAGIVVEEDGTPVARARVSCARASGWGHAEISWADASGAFRYAQPADVEYLLAVWRPSRTTGAPAAEVLATAGASPVTITLRREEGHLLGTAISRTGAPAAGAAIRVWPERRPDYETRVRADPDGSFRVGPLQAGRYAVELHLDGEPTLHLDPAIDLRPGEARDLGTIRFPVGGRIRGRVLDESGNPLPDADVQVWSSDGFITYAGRRQEGAYVSEELAPGRYLVTGGMPGIIEEVALVAGDVAPVDLRLRGGGTLLMMAVLADGRGTDALFQIDDVSGRLVSHYGHGTRVLHASGDYRITARDDRDRRGEATARIGRNDGIVEVVLVLR